MKKIFLLLMMILMVSGCGGSEEKVPLSLLKFKRPIKKFS